SRTRDARPARARRARGGRVPSTQASRLSVRGRGAPRGPGAKGPSAFRLPLAMFSERALGLEAPQIPFATQRLQPFDALDGMRLRCFQATAHAQRIAERALRFVDEPILRRHHFASERVRTFELFDRFVAA